MTASVLGDLLLLLADLAPLRAFSLDAFTVPGANRWAMTDEQVDAITETISEISTEYFFLLIMYISEEFITSMTYYIILMIFAYKIFAVVNAHLTSKKMADKVGYFWPYSDREKRHLVAIFERGLEAEGGEEAVRKALHQDGSGS
jgi:hypothetical protein